MRAVFILFIVLSSLAFCHEKTYIQPDQISFAENAIFVLIDQQWISTESLHVDARGIYITDGIRDIFHWICPKCGYQNGLFNKRCQNCGY